MQERPGLHPGQPAGGAGAVFANLNATLSNIRAAGFKGVLMVVHYFSLDCSDAAQTGLTVALNQALSGGETCYAGLLNGDPTNPLACDVHPSLSGQRLLAKTVAATYRTVRRGDD